MNPKTSLSIRQFCLGWQVICKAAPNHITETVPGMELMFSRIPIPFFNVAVLTDHVSSAADLHSLGAGACSWARDKNVPWFLIVSHEALEQGVNANAALEECGLAPLLNLTGMVADDVAPLGKTPEGLALTIPSDDESSAAMLEVNAAAYGMDMQPAGSVLGSYAFWKNLFPVIGRKDGKPVSCSGTIILEGYRYVAFVATHPDHRRQGFANAAMRRSLDLAAEAHGSGPTFLHATDAGRPMYEKMGYAPVSTHALFIERRFLEGH